MNEIGAVGYCLLSLQRGPIYGKSCRFLIVSLSKDLSLDFMCSDQHVKYWMLHGFSFNSSLLLHYRVEQYTHIHRLLSTN